MNGRFYRGPRSPPQDNILEDIALPLPAACGCACVRWWAQVTRRPRPRGRRSPARCGAGGAVWRSSHKRLFRDLQWPVRFSYSRSTRCCGRAGRARPRARGRLSHTRVTPAPPAARRTHLSHTRQHASHAAEGPSLALLSVAQAYKGFRVAGSRLWPGLAFGLITPRCLFSTPCAPHTPLMMLACSLASQSAFAGGEQLSPSCLQGPGPARPLVNRPFRPNVSSFQ